MMEVAAAALFPLLMLGGGAYLVFRGLKRKMGRVSPISGQVYCSDPASGLISGEKCVYCKVTVEYYQRGAVPWKEVYSYCSMADFKIGPTPVDPAFAVFSLPPPRRFEGYVRPNPGLFDAVGPGIRQLRGIADVTSEISPSEMIDEPVLKAVLSLPGAKEKLKNYLGGALRISEQCLPVGSQATVTPDPAAPQTGKISGSIGYPLHISVYGSRGVMEEKAVMSIALGSFFILLSLALLILLVF